ncbi:hypothetical protein BDP27DRAFT_1428370 [Rhodocollybia butyracea]|uniref:Uncharacterized protein n=1 Tax=Rhodocollybia butyracea TaxID=206335 RepID=A0A9P5PF34_9AGAR|nr:hypothetical protein BDP27DRAFT_1428370 [Rhodocollybia butyracea]
MPSFTSLPTKLTTNILQIYVAFYIDPSFDINCVPLNDSSALELEHLSNRKELLSMLTVCRTFAAVLPPLIFQWVNIFSTRAVASFYRAVCSHSGECIG